MAAEKNNQTTAIGTVEDPTRGRPYHDAETAKLKQMLREKQKLDAEVAIITKNISDREQEYFESTPNGNILTGFDSYIKGGGGAAGAGRRKGGFTDADRVFSRFAIKNETVDSPSVSAVTTPSHAPTPVASSFLKGSESAAGTPGSATSGKQNGAGTKKASKRAGGGGGGGGDDSETDADGKGSKKARTTGRK